MLANNGMRFAGAPRVLSVVVTVYGDIKKSPVKGAEQVPEKGQV